MASESKVRYMWRTKYPWLFVMYILVIGILRGLVQRNPTLGLDLLMIAAFTSYIFLYIFYLYGVKPVELEHHFHKKKK